ncbi:hypothetical protein GCM10018793_35910 [Streptomyces sulfonofaciens]|uniref:PPM-type phosphatase domain-containing protein n=1 Tax=Streptomyces sulfonofaciens TaxID=68272 RepID=A0A919G9Z3_9ACTN|nr:PP2C family protein-serine/threonine phosphatase [Streptomyces sulfonofaciens]GHH80554.1 hypothetical protein GCM10018793_35910 [Streptomyces sulfonofaciens]
MSIRIPGAVFGDPTTTGWPLILAPLVLVVAIPVTDHFLDPNVHIAPLLSVVPAFTAAIAGTWATALMSVLAVLAQVVAGAERHTLGSEQVLTEIVALVLLSALLTLFTYVRETHRSQLRRVRLISETAQRAVLRPLPERSGPLGIATEYRTAETDTRIGGDLFALARTADSTRLLIGDVRGKGLDSITDTSIMLGAFRAAAHRQSPLPELVAYLEGSVHWGLSELAGVEADVGERFVTAVVADIPDDEPVIRLVSCGHPPPLLLRNGAATPLVVGHPAPPLGLGGLATSAYAPQTFPFPVGGHVLLYTDGVSEARDRDGVFYPLADRAATAGRVVVWADGGPEMLVEYLTSDLMEYTGQSLNDDMAMIAVKRIRLSERAGRDGAADHAPGATEDPWSARRPADGATRRQRGGEEG